jgi:hypothetical protein
MQSNLIYEDWIEILNQSYPIEFGWVGVDNNSHIAYFSTFNQAYTPKKAILSFEKYLRLAELINDLPEISSSTLYTKQKGWFHDWHFHSRRGLFAYDWLDAHRNQEDRKNRYDLLTVPDNPIDLSSISGIEQFDSILPRFNLFFGDNISFSDLQNSEF